MIGSHRIISFLLTTMSHSKMKMLPTEDEVCIFWRGFPNLTCSSCPTKLKLWLEKEDSLADQVDALISEALQDFPDEDDLDEAAKYAAEIARVVITDKTRYGHLR